MPQTILVTGATDGHGRGVALELARLGATVLVHGRDPSRVQNTLEELRRETKNEHRGYVSDFASLTDVAAFAERVLADEKRLDVLVNNAGIGTRVPGEGARQESHDGHELRFAVNYLAPFLLTMRLLPLLKASAPARIVNVSSAGQQAIDWSDVMLTRNYTGVRAYCQSKLAQILFTVELGAELQGSGVTVNALHPATYMPTKIVPKPMSSLEEGVRATVRLATDPKLASTTGRYFDGLVERRADVQAYDVQARKQLRVLSERLTGLT